jgi:hypothetical protein
VKGSSLSEEEGGFGITLAEKFFGLIIIVAGAMAMYYTFTSTDALNGFLGFFGFLSIFLLAIGVVLVIAKTE